MATTTNQSKLNVPPFTNRKVLVVGDAILDCYWQGNASRLSREAPVPVINNCKESFRCGGAANAAANVVSLGGKATLVAVCGNDQEGKSLQDHCKQAGINLAFRKVASATTTKLRILSQGQQVLRVDSDANLPSQAAEQLAKTAIGLIDKHDAILLSDYGYGALGAVTKIIKQANLRGKPVIVDPRNHDWQIYHGATLLTPNQGELTAATGSEAISKTLTKYKLKAILLTKSKDGMELHRPSKKNYSLPTHSIDVFDVTGAGDSVCAAMALGMAAKLDMPTAMRWANIAAGVAVTRLGTVAVDLASLAAGLSGVSSQIMQVKQLPKAITKLREQGKKIVMTNGCYDMLHAGHLSSLIASAHCGDVLIVAVNDDASVAKLKGPTRPVIKLLDRMTLLAGLDCVDLVVPFSSTNAASIVKIVKPDIYTKGSDWKGKRPPEVVAANQVGSEIIYLDLQTGISTTKIVDQINRLKS